MKRGLLALNEQAVSQVAVNTVKSKAMKPDIKSGVSEQDVKSKMTLAKAQNFSPEECG